MGPKANASQPYTLPSPTSHRTSRHADTKMQKSMLLASAHRKTKKRKHIPPFDVLHEHDWPW